MGFLPLLKICGLLALSFYAVGLGFRLMGTYYTRNDFREKGFLRIPTEKQWIGFLLNRRYELFDNPMATFLYGTSRVCLLGLMLCLGAVVLLGACTVMFYVVADVQS